MIGIVSYGVYIPWWRLARGAIAEGLKGEKAIAGFDEDSLTMSVAAAMDCLKGFDRGEIEGVFFASTSAPYLERSGSAVIAAAVDLSREIVTADISHSLKSGTTALKLGADLIKGESAKRVIVTAADCRLGRPGSDKERGIGDGAAAFLLGDSDTIADIEGWHSTSDAIMDIWRTDKDQFIRSWENRFVATEGYRRVINETVSGMLKKTDLSPKDFAKVIFGIPDQRNQKDIARSLGFEPETQLIESFAGLVGETGSSYPLILLAAALEKAKGGDRILVASYGNGCDVLIIRVNERIENLRDRRGVRGHLENKKVINDYTAYLRWREIVPWERLPFPAGFASAPAQWREEEQNYRFYGGRCKSCGTIQYPPQRVCVNCRGKDEGEPVRLAEKRGKIVTFTADYVTAVAELPVASGVIDFEDGGRIFCYLSDVDVKDLRVGMSVEMSFRKIAYREGMYIYFWKAVPARD